MQHRAIETRYKGYRFRSRLEARWAVFFDAEKVRWEYEPEGFELPGGIRYLPDFHLPDLDLWVEVKAEGVPRTDAERGKIEGFVEATGNVLLVTNGLPGERTLDLHYLDRHIGGEVDLQIVDCVPDFRVGRIYVDHGHDENEPAGSEFFFKGRDIDNDPEDVPFLWSCAARKSSIAAARGARFEFGESGAAR